MRLIAEHHIELAQAFTMTVPPWSIVRSAHDKRLLYKRAASLGIDHPLSYYPRDAREVEALDCCFPVILKPTLREQRNAFTKAKGWRCDRRSEAKRRRWSVRMRSSSRS